MIRVGVGSKIGCATPPSEILDLDPGLNQDDSGSRPLVNRMRLESAGTRLLWLGYFVFRDCRSVASLFLCSTDIVLFITET